MTEMMLKCRKCGFLNASTEENCKSCGKPLKAKKQILEENVRKIMTKVGFFIDTETKSLETVRKFYEVDITIEIDNNPRFAEWSLTKLSSGKVFIHHDGLTYELEPSDTEHMGIIFTKSKPKRITQAQALELVKSGIPFYDSPQLTSQCVLYKRQ